jgi:hypothetical protein
VLSVAPNVCILRTGLDKSLVAVSDGRTQILDAHVMACMIIATELDISNISLVQL